MSKKDKLLKRFLEKESNELDTLLISCGFSKIDGAGLAVKFYNKDKEVCDG